MSPEQIQEVRDTWSLAMQTPERMEAAIADRLPGPADLRTSRAHWIVNSVSTLSRVIDHPAAFASAAKASMPQPSPVTIDQLAAERDALMSALREQVGVLGPDREQAWTLAFGLFEETVVALCLDPFGCRDIETSTLEERS